MEITLTELEALRANLAPYINASGIVTIEAGAPASPGDGNGLMQTGLMYCILAQFAPLSKVDLDRVDLLGEACLSSKVPLLYRSPFKKNPDDDNNHDDYRGWLAACYHVGSAYPKAFLAYAEAHGWYIDVQQPEQERLKYLFSRFIEFPAFARACAGAKAKLLDGLFLSLAILWGAAFDVSKSDSCIKEYCLITVARKSSTLARLASRVWFWRVRRRYGITGQAFAAYFKSRVHPLCVGDWP